MTKFFTNKEFKPKLLLVAGALLSIFGLLLIYSSSSQLGLQRHGDSFYFVKKHLMYLGCGWGVFLLARANRT